MLALHELPEVGGVAGGHQRNIRQNPSGNRTRKPEMVTVQDIGRELQGSVSDRLGKGPFIGGQLFGVQRIKAGAGVGHDIAHARNGKVQIAFGKSDETTAVPVNTGDFGYTVAGDAGDEKIVMTGRRSLADDVLQVKTATGAFRMLTDEMEYLQCLCCFPSTAYQGCRG